MNAAALQVQFMASPCHHCHCCCCSGSPPQPWGGPQAPQNQPRVPGHMRRLHEQNSSPSLTCSTLNTSGTHKQWQHERRTPSSSVQPKGAPQLVRLRSRPSRVSWGHRGADVSRCCTFRTHRATRRQWPTTTPPESSRSHDRRMPSSPPLSPQSVNLGIRSKQKRQMKAHNQLKLVLELYGPLRPKPWQHQRRRSGTTWADGLPLLSVDA